MNQQYYFKNAKWICQKNRTVNSFSVVRGLFNADNAQKATLKILGLGFFKCYINGICVNPDTFLPLSSDYEDTCDPINETISGHRVYVPEFDITSLIKHGENVISAQFGGGWYCCHVRTFGLPKIIYCITVEEKNGSTYDYISDESCLIHSGYVCDYDFLKYEHQDLQYYDLLSAQNTAEWENAIEAEPLRTEYCTTLCPHDKLIQTLDVKEISKTENSKIYDCQKNTTGVVVLQIHAQSGEQVKVLFSEEINADGTLDLSHAHGQQFTVLSDGQNRTVQAEFTWFGFRYFEIQGDASPICVKEIHSDIEVSSTFECDIEVLNWTYKTFIHTMLSNMHTGHPSDCPHIERRGYTGDGQLTCNASLTTLDCEAFYRKWLTDICDCQDTVSGHIQYTAPYIRSGGGPGGWGIAIVEVPYQIYKHYGDISVLENCYPKMLKYIQYLEDHSEFSLVTTDKKGEWCLGDWCGPNVLYPDKNITLANQQMILPAPMVNTYFMVKALEKMCEIAKLINKNEDIEVFKEKIDQRKKAITAAYFNAFDNNFLMNVQGANSFAVDIGLGNNKTYSNMVNYYSRLGCYDTGIFGTDILTRVLFEKGDAELAVDLLKNYGDQGYARWMKNGATTFHEYWDSSRSRSHNHPMFGSTIAYFYEYLLGIKQENNTAAYTSLIIEPQAISKFKYIKGSMKIPAGMLFVAYEKSDTEIIFTITLPCSVNASLKYKDNVTKLNSGENVIRYSL